MRHIAALLTIALLSASALAESGLDLEVRLETDSIDHEAEVAYVVRFVNRGEAELRLLEPLHAGLVSFPVVRFVHEDGRVFAPHDAPFQSMLRDGLQGKIVALAPGERAEYAYRRALFVSIDPGAPELSWREAAPLPPGSYTVRVSYEKEDDRAVYAKGFDERKLRVVEGLFTGKIEAAPAHILVGPPTRPSVRISQPVGDSGVLEVRLENPLDSEVTFRGVPRLTIDSKAYGSAEASPLLLTPGDAKDEAPVAIVVPARGRKDYRIDLRSLSFTRDGAVGELSEMLPEGLVRMGLWLDGVGHQIWADIPPVPNRGLEGLSVTTRLSSGEIAAGAEVALTVHLENLSDADKLIVYRFTFPRECVVRIEDADGRRRSICSVKMSARSSSNGDRLLPWRDEICRIPEGSSWDGASFEAAPPLTRKDYIMIEPEAGILRDLDLTKLLADGFTPGRYRIFAGYRNLASGAHLGFAPDRLAPTGVVWSEPVILVVK